MPYYAISKLYVLCGIHIALFLNGCLTDWLAGWLVVTARSGRCWRCRSGLSRCAP